MIYHLNQLRSQQSHCILFHVVPMTLCLFPPPSVADILHVNITTANAATRNSLYVFGKVDLSL